MRSSAADSLLLLFTMRSKSEQERTSGRHWMALRRDFVSCFVYDRSGGLRKLFGTNPSANPLECQSIKRHASHGRALPLAGPSRVMATPGGGTNWNCAGGIATLTSTDMNFISSLRVSSGWVTNILRGKQIVWSPVPAPGALCQSL